MWNGKAMIIRLMIRLIKNIVIERQNLILKHVTSVDTSNFCQKDDFLDIDKWKNVPSGLNSLKSKVDKLDVDKVETVLIDFEKLIDVADKYFF